MTWRVGLRRVKPRESQSLAGGNNAQTTPADCVCLKSQSGLSVSISQKYPNRANKGLKPFHIVSEFLLLGEKKPQLSFLDEGEFSPVLTGVTEGNAVKGERSRGLPLPCEPLLLSTSRSTDEGNKCPRLSMPLPSLDITFFFL